MTTTEVSARATDEVAPRAPVAGAAPVTRVLVLDDEPALRRSIARILIPRGFDVLTAEDGPSALALLATTSVDVLLCDLQMPGMSGMQVLAEVKRSHPGVEVVMMAAFGEIDSAVAAVRAGAYEFLTRPFASNEVVVLALDKAAEHRRLLTRTRQLEERLEQHEKFGELVGRSSRMQDVYRLALGVAPTSSTVLVLGESGTGKELVARAIHQHSSRAERPFMAIHCGAIPEALIESQLLGSARGAFAGALDRPGILELADRGTVFLDEVGALPLSAQVSLLRALSQGEIQRIGATDSKLVDLRVIAATNVDLRERIASGRFREDLFYRLNVIPIHLPPLRQRKDDIPLLAYHFLHKFCRRAQRDVKRIGVEALRLLRDHDWPGNVRELENAIEHAVVMTRGDVVLPQDLPAACRSAPVEPLSRGAPAGFAPDLAELSYTGAKDRVIDDFDRAYVHELLRRTSGNVSESARQARMDRSNFRRLMKKVKGLPEGEGS